MKHKNKHSNFYKETEEEYNCLNNELAVPAFRKFCKENGLLFHFWDELSKDKFDPEVGDKELDLLQEALELFNRLKPELNYFKGKIVRFQYTSWDEFDYDIWEMDDFLSFVSDEIKYVKFLQRKPLLGLFIKNPEKRKTTQNHDLIERLEKLKARFLK
ncbi:MAG: hypothetical protein H8D23_40460 [Candidatus Brocadiales bacterium]|nr:hypothetical protein [Candidatus Brocadiales bacterium]